MMMKKKTKGPKPGRIRIEGDWVGAVGKAIKKRRPEDGWPDAGKNEKEKKESPGKD